MVSEPVGDDDAGVARITDRDTVLPLLAALPPRNAPCSTLRFFVSMKQTQIAERIGLSQMQVSRMLDTTLRELRAQV